MTRGFVTTPRWVLVPAVAGALVILLPLLGMVLRIDWAHLGELLTSESSLAALWLSLRTAVASTALCLVLGAEGPGLRDKTLVAGLVEQLGGTLEQGAAQVRFEFQAEPVSESAMAGSTMRILPYSSATGAMASAPPASQPRQDLPWP